VQWSDEVYLAGDCHLGDSPSVTPLSSLNVVLVISVVEPCDDDCGSDDGLSRGVHIVSYHRHRSAATAHVGYHCYKRYCCQPETRLGYRQVRTQKPPFLPLKNDTKYHERRKYEKIIWWKAEIFTLHKVLMRHVRT